MFKTDETFDVKKLGYFTEGYCAMVTIGGF